jgi:hypothetical protein
MNKFNDNDIIIGDKYALVFNKLMIISANTSTCTYNVMCSSTEIVFHQDMRFIDNHYKLCIKSILSKL